MTNGTDVYPMEQTIVIVEDEIAAIGNAVLHEEGIAISNGVPDYHRLIAPLADDDFVETACSPDVIGDHRRRYRYVPTHGFLPMSKDSSAPLQGAG